MSYTRIQPSVFAGPAQWMALHSYAAAYEPSSETRKAAIEYVNAIAVLFPCEKCSRHFKEFLSRNNIEHYLSDNHRFFLWTYLAHDGATRHKGETSPPYNEVKRYYFESLLGSCNKCG